MVRAAAKNWQDVAVVIDPAHYAGVVAELKARGRVSTRARSSRLPWRPSTAPPTTTARSATTCRRSPARATACPSAAAFPAQANRRFVKLQDLRYGENPHQSAAFYRERSPRPARWCTAKQLQGKELCYNNIADADAAWECVKSFGRRAPAACVIVKHANPCGVAIGGRAAEAYAKALKTDPDLGLRRHRRVQPPVDGAAPKRVAKQFVEVLIAPAFSAEALRGVRRQEERARPAVDLPRDAGAGRNTLDIKRVGSGLLLQTADNHELDPAAS